MIFTLEAPDSVHMEGALKISSGFNTGRSATSSRTSSSSFATTSLLEEAVPFESGNLLRKSELQ